MIWEQEDNDLIRILSRIYTLHHIQEYAAISYNIEIYKIKA